MFLPASKLPARVLAGIAVAAFAGVSFALIAQHVFGVKPCPWCVMQRGIFLLIGAVALLGWLARGLRPLRLASLGLIVLLALAGLASAYYQHDVAAKMASCSMTVADKLITALNLEELWPPVFMVTASCAEAAAYKLLGLPYEAWSALLYLLLALAALLGLRTRR
ncbi:disulfide bond formation protein B [Roseateles sp. DAIF2]|uniref:disulfide bond formation protein B n=1 Tax=Roseateles sp. DAIF2 TaxID=2714952 RepID=UPI0018A31DE5|nr:disulfide bond formation protein B [Roseateles sp. DAIF2]QPF73337.1 disulfide bond formation protein B [Roseateles sp. DAIF2]